jgi:hypothetical protein
MTRIALAILLAGSPTASRPPAATPLAFESRAERTEVRLGEPFWYEIVVRHRAQESYGLPDDVDLSPFRVEGGRCRREEAGDEVTTTCALRLALMDLGTHDVPEVALAVRGQDGARTLAVTGPSITALGMTDPAAAPGSLPLRDIAPPAPLLVRSWRLLWWAGAALATAGLVWWSIARLRRRPGTATEPAPPLPPEVRFARRLDALEAAGLPRRGEVQEYFFRLSEMVREYLGALAGIPALELTTPELLAALGRDPDPRLDLGALRDFCERVDLVKFARAPAGEAECGEAMGFARELLERTRPTSTSTSTPTATSTATSTRSRR